MGPEEKSRYEVGYISTYFGVSYFPSGPEEKLRFIADAIISFEATISPRVERRGSLAVLRTEALPRFLSSHYLGSSRKGVMA